MKRLLALLITLTLLLGCAGIGDEGGPGVAYGDAVHFCQGEILGLFAFYMMRLFLTFPSLSLV